MSMSLDRPSDVIFEKGLKHFLSIFNIDEIFKGKKLMQIYGAGGDKNI